MDGCLFQQGLGSWQARPACDPGWETVTYLVSPRGERVGDQGLREAIGKCVGSAPAAACLSPTLQPRFLR